MDNNTIIAICSIIIALLALITTIWQGIISRKHNRLSVLPHLRITRDIVKKDKVIYELKNCGIGPAIITSYKLNVDGKLYSEKDIPPYQVICELLGVDKGICRFYLPDIGQAISPGEEIVLFAIDYSGEKIDSFPEKLINGFNTIVEYKSIYGKTFKTQYIPRFAPAG